ncbi:MAG: SPOR domain-containing protein [Deltaproteobacteria bacterium]|nr:SPOR domain-containing protein [Deltaproteobacteria bacterium]
MQDLGRFTKQNHVEIQTRYVSLLIFGSIALVGLVFALGVLVGSRQGNQSSCPEPDPLAMLDFKSNEPVPPASREVLDLSFHKSLSVKLDPVPTPASLTADEAGSESGDTGKEQAGPGLSGDVSLAKPRMEEPPVPEKVANDEPGTYSLQVGSFQDRVEASQMVRKLERAGHHTFLVSVNMPERGGMWYRVRVGPFQSKREAWLYKRQFEERERLPAFVVKRRAKS